MLLSKKAARVLAIASTFAFTLTGMSAAQPLKVQAAADQAPTVKVLGATLRLDSESGKQSLRFGIEVSNASNAEACGIDITYNGKTVTVGTDVENDTDKGKKKHTEVYSKDGVNDKIVYSAVITGIPKANYSEAFNVKGYVKEKVALANKGESTAVNKSVTNVVDALKEAYPALGLEIDETTGNLMKTVDGNKSEVKDTDFGTEVENGNVDMVPEGATVLDLGTCFHTNDLNKAENEDGSVIFTSKTDGGTFAGVMVKLPNSLSLVAGNSVNITVDYSCDGASETARVYLLNGANDGAKSNIIGPGGSPLSGTLTATDSADSFYIKAMNSGSSFTSLTINKITVEVGDTVAPVDAPKPGFNEDGTEYTLPINENTVIVANGWVKPTVSFNFNKAYNSVTISKPEGENREFGIRLPKDIYEKNDFCKAIVNFADANNTEKCGYVAKYNTDDINWKDGEESHYSWSEMNGSGTVELTPNNAFNHFSGFRIFDGSKGSTITIKSVVFVKSDESARPTPTPEPTSTPKVVATCSLDLSAEGVCIGENGGSGSYNADTKTIDATLGQYNGVCFKLPDNETETYNRIEIDYTLTSGLNSYVYDGAFSGFGQGVGGTHDDVDKLAATTEMKTAVYDAQTGYTNDEVKAIKFFNFGGTATLKISAIRFVKLQAVTETTP